MDTTSQTTPNNIDYADELPEEIRQAIEAMRAQKDELISALGLEVRKKIDEAVAWRRSCGIEQIWQEDDEYYHGIDDYNRDNVAFLKNPSTTGGLISNKKVEHDSCTAFFNITRQFCDAAASRMGDILLPAGDWNFTIKPTPVPDIGKEVPQQFNDVPGAAKIEQQQNADAIRRCEKSEKRIRDWLTECKYHLEVRKVLESAARRGSGILKGPVPEHRMSKRIAEQQGRVSLVIEKQTYPVSYAVNIWDFYPDPACGDDIHNGSYVVERARMSARALRELKGLDGYLADRIDQVIDEGPDRCNYDGEMKIASGLTTGDEQFEVWYYYGLIDLNKLDAIGVPSIADQKRDEVPACVVIVNDTPIKAFLNPLDSGEFPYDLMPWQAISGLPWGIGVARQGRTPQDMMNAACRALMDNAGLSAGPQIIVRPKAINPADGNWTLTGRKIWIASEEADYRTVQDAIMAINIPMWQAELNGIIQLAIKCMEDSTGIFFIMQGQQGNAPDTVGGMILLNQNASSILRRLARLFDIQITEPHIRRYYEWLLMYGEDDEKGDWQIEAVGSTALIDRDIQSMMAMQILNLSVNPAFGLDPEKTAEEVLKAARFIPEKLKMDEGKRKLLAQPNNPTVEAAKIRAQIDREKIETDRWKAKVQATVDQRRMEVDTDRDNIYQQTMEQRDLINAQSRREELAIRRELAMLDYANQRGINLDRVKADLAKTAMELKTQIKLTHGGYGPQVAEPLVEPPGRAEEGRAYVD